jgi:hypothetical protein
VVVVGAADVAVGAGAVRGDGIGDRPAALEEMFDEPDELAPAARARMQAASSFSAEWRVASRRMPRQDRTPGWMWSRPVSRRST